MPNKYLQIDGVATFVHHTGATTLPETPPRTDRGEVFLCLHGEGGHGGLFAEILDALAERHSPIAFDQPGHGRSGSLDSLGSIDRMADFTRTFCEKLGLPPLVVVGHGMGAAVGIRLALDEPSRVRGLVLCAAGASSPHTPEALEHARRVREGKAQRPFDPKIFSSKTAPDVMRKTFMQGMKTDPRATHGDLVAFSEWNDEARLGEIAPPCLVLHGEDELEAVRDRADRLEAALPNATRTIIPEAGHALLLEAPARVAEAIDAFVGAALSPGGGSA